MNTLATDAPWEAASVHATETTSKKAIWAGRILSGVPALFLVVDGVMKLFKPAVVVEATVKLGYPEASIVGIGLVLLASTTLYLIPRTAIVGAVLLTGYLGGAVATQVRVSDLANAFIPVFIGTLLWGGLWFRHRSVRALLPFVQRG